MKRFVLFNANPAGNDTTDCVVRAISVLTGMHWTTVYRGIAEYGAAMFNTMESNEVWGQYLWDLGYRKRPIPDTCPFCYSVYEFCMDHPIGKYLLMVRQHVVAVVDGQYFDTWNCGSEIPDYYWIKEK